MTARPCATTMGCSGPLLSQLYIRTTSDAGSGETRINKQQVNQTQIENRTPPERGAITRIRHTGILAARWCFGRVVM